MDLGESVAGTGSLLLAAVSLRQSCPRKVFGNQAVSWFALYKLDPAGGVFECGDDGRRLFAIAVSFLKRIERRLQQPPRRSGGGITQKRRERSGDPCAWPVTPKPDYKRQCEVVPQVKSVTNLAGVKKRARLNSFPEFSLRALRNHPHKN